MIDELKKANLKNKKNKTYYDKKEFLDLVKADAVDPAVDMVIHMGACSSTVLQDKRYFQENNFEYSCHLAVWCFQHGVRFIYASSAATYGDGSQGYSDDENKLKKLKPLNLY